MRLTEKKMRILIPNGIAYTDSWDQDIKPWFISINTLVIVTIGHSRVRWRGQPKVPPFEESSWHCKNSFIPDNFVSN